ncbi:hypothetical protein ACFWGN_20940, partial [Oerskovia sp. NPDC060338]
MSTALKTASGHRLRDDAAASFDRLNVGRRWILTDSERPLSVQIEIFEDRYPSLVSLGVPDRRGPWKGRYWWRRPGTAAAAVPGTSNHGTGTAIDVTGLGHVGSPAWNAFRDTAEPHGWRHPDWAKRTVTYEPWHWEYHPALDAQPVSKPGPSTAGSITSPTIPGAPAPIEEEDDTMLVIARTKADPQVWIGDGLTRRRVTTQDTLKNIQWLATNGLLRVAKAGTVQTIEDLWALGHPIADDLSTVQSAVAAVPGAVWGHRLEHTLAKGPTGKPATVAAGDL